MQGAAGTSNVVASARITSNFGYNDIEIDSFTAALAFPIITRMSIKQVKIDLLSAAAIGAFALFVLSPLFA